MLGLATIILPHLHSQLIQSNRQTEQQSHMLRENEETTERNIFKWHPNNNNQTCNHLLHEYFFLDKYYFLIACFS